MFNHFDVTLGCNTLGCKPRSATIDERNAYLEWLAQRDGIAIPNGAKLGDEGISLKGEIILPMPGYGDDRRPMLEVLDDDGNVIRSTPIAVDARGRMALTKGQVQEATGLKPVRAKASKRAPAVAERVAEPAPIADAQPVPVAAERQPERAGEDVAAILARMERLERQVATLSRQSAPIGGKAPRSPAHERAVRRAWAERSARRLAEREAASWRASSRQHWREVEVIGGQRDRATPRARRLIMQARRDRTFQRQRGDVLHAQLVALRAAMADPSQPERASDVNRLMAERDQARNACAALEQRVAGMQGALEQVATAVEEWSGRAIRAEAELRRAAPIAA